MPDDVAQVHHDHFRKRRRTKLTQIEAALSGNCENLVMSLGFDVGTLEAIGSIS